MVDLPDGLIIVLITTDTPPLEQGRQKFINVILSFFKYSMSVTLYLSVLSDQNKSWSFLNASFMFHNIHSLPDSSLTYLLTSISVLSTNR